MYPIKDTFLILNLFIEEKKLLFHFKDEVISMDFDIVKRDEVMKALGRL